jgi:hypothetical protein
MGTHNVFEKVRCLANKDMSMCMPREIEVHIVSLQKHIQRQRRCEIIVTNIVPKSTTRKSIKLF